MRLLFACSVATLAILACNDGYKDRIVHAQAEGCVADTTQYPRQTADGKHIVYLRGTMTPDKGLKVYVDTASIAFNDARAQLLHDALKKNSGQP